MGDWLGGSWSAHGQRRPEGEAGPQQAQQRPSPPPAAGLQPRSPAPLPHRLLRASSAFSVSAVLTAKQTECSEEACEIMMTLMLLSRITLQAGQGSKWQRHGHV